MATTTIVIDKIAAAVTATGVKLVEANSDFFTDGESLHFDHGHMVEITGKLLKKNKSKMKYPLIILVEDIDQYNYAGMLHYNLRLFIVNFNPREQDDSPQRWAKGGVIKGRLLPIYEEFLRQISAKGFSWDKAETPGVTPPHTFTVRTKFGVWLRELNGTVRNMLTDPLDAIEIQDLKINTKALSCV